MVRSGAGGSTTMTTNHAALDEANAATIVAVERVDEATNIGADHE